MKNFLTCLLFLISTNAFAEVQLTCIASRLSHTLMVVHQPDEAPLTVQFFQNGNPVTEVLILRPTQDENQPQYVYVRKGTGPEYVKFSPGALNPNSNVRRSHALVGARLENLYNCLRH